jgi:hypothetical protein
MATDAQIRDFVRPEERDEYFQMVAGLRAQLKPEGALEEVFAEAIIGATWRLRRCAHIEARIAETCSLDPMESDSAARLQNSVDRARAQYHNILRRSIAELRRLQTQKTIRSEVLGPADASVRDLTSYSKRLARKLDSIEAPLPGAKAPAAELGSFCKTPRNAPCPCGSGRKHKRCCGHAAPPVLQQAA